MDNMPDWFVKNLGEGLDISTSMMVYRMTVSVVCGLAVAATHWRTQRGVARSPLGTTLVLLTVLVAITAIVIGNNVARAFSLVGALSIVRFRTAVDDTRDTAFVVFAVVVGMAAGTGQFAVCAVGIPIVSAAACVLHRLHQVDTSIADERRLDLRIAGDRDPEALCAEIFALNLDSHRLCQILTAKQGSSLDVRYAVRLKDSSQVLDFVRALQRIDGVQSVEWKETL